MQYPGCRILDLEQVCMILDPLGIPLGDFRARQAPAGTEKASKIGAFKTIGKREAWVILEKSGNGGQKPSRTNHLQAPRLTWHWNVHQGHSGGYTYIYIHVHRHICVCVCYHVYRYVWIACAHVGTCWHMLIYASICLVCQHMLQ